MINNVGTVDKVIRILLALVIAALGWYYQTWWGLVAILPLVTAFVGFCPAYFPFKISTAKKKS
ncbi:MAG: DUF2892 domain-containing protein [Bacteroidetes bacterium HGW-Bacteroidetes-16]|jgi:ABC-type bacteriocin/lantibiotic exporter with double-glycine peptidase domain|nr:MAG: DUF2892 domain-containing protein [Bacteroidetes bacterium HGW-Bacteroidetes-16]